jgi:hypothetical protein
MKRKSDESNDPPAKQGKHPLNKYVQTPPTSPPRSQVPPPTSPPRSQLPPPRIPPRSPSPTTATERQTKRLKKTAEHNSYMKADKTNYNYTKAIRMFNKFADQQQYVPQFEDLTEPDLASSDENLGLKTILHNFAFWLLKEKQSNGKFYAPAVSVGFLSNFKTVLCKKFHKMEIVKEIEMLASAVNWYSDLHSCLEMRATVAAIERGEQVNKKTLSVGRQIIIYVTRHLLKQDKAESYENRAVLAILRQAVGRGGEIGSSVWCTSSFNLDTEQWELEWPEEKTGTANLMSFSRDNTNYELDVFHAMACYTMLLEGRYTPDDQGYLFPCFANMRKGGASTKVTNIMKQCVGKVEGVTDRMTASGIRVGSTDEMVFSPKINDIVAIMRGAWYFEGDSRMYYYLTKRAHVSKGGLVLGNHEDPNKVVPMYRLDSILTEKNRGLVDNYIFRLFGATSGKYSFCIYLKIKFIFLTI